LYTAYPDWSLYFVYFLVSQHFNAGRFKTFFSATLYFTLCHFYWTIVAVVLWQLHGFVFMLLGNRIQFVIFLLRLAHVNQLLETPRVFVRLCVICFCWIFMSLCQISSCFCTEAYPEELSRH
jgi:hypothetical protein